MAGRPENIPSPSVSAGVLFADRTGREFFSGSTEDVERRKIALQTTKGSLLFWRGSLERLTSSLPGNFDKIPEAHRQQFSRERWGLFSRRQMEGLYRFNVSVEGILPYDLPEDAQELLDFHSQEVNLLVEVSTARALVDALQVSLYADIMEVIDLPRSWQREHEHYRRLAKRGLENMTDILTQMRQQKIPVPEGLLAYYQEWVNRVNTLASLSQPSTE